VARTGRPSKLTPEITALICDYIDRGAYVEVAAQACGIGRATLYRWLKENEDFQDAVKTARAKAMVASIAMVRSGESGWQGSAWYLERVYPTLYASDRKKKRSEIELNNAKLAEMKTLEELLSKASATEIDAIVARLVARGRSEGQ
jgi:hypothetical protein